MQLGSRDPYAGSYIPANGFEIAPTGECPPGYVKVKVKEAITSRSGWDVVSNVPTYDAVYACVPIGGNAASNASPAMPAVITVSPQISTQVSPQISPVFQQQFQPSGSPISAGTSQTAPAAQSSPQGVSAADVQRMLADQAAQMEAQRKAEAEARAADQAAFMKALEMQQQSLATAMAAQSSQPAPLPSMPAAPIEAAAPVPAIPVSAPLSLTSAAPSDMKPAIIVAAVVAALAIMGKKGKR